ncbi:hypothetical protein V5O48_014444 [Marasmius crinis-equi]|uniref:Beta-lactamase-related domain-containing protein n=1 Tax=Marasmius crinis-equi TaxID=585013 RepID=A0ABR3EXK2_9AGAR
MRSFLSLYILSSFLPVSVRSAQVLTPEIDTFVEGVLSGWGSPGGVSVAVVRLDGTGEWSVETKGFGVARLDDNSTVTSDTLFPIGSNSKLFTLVATGLLTFNESLTPRVSWDTKIASVIPTWEVADPIASNKSSIIDLMGHRTGLPRHDFMYRRNDSLASVAQRLKSLKPSTEFRETFQYNNIMYAMLSYLPEVLSTRTPLARYVKKNVFDPLGMNSTTYSFDVANAKGVLSPGVTRQNLSLASGLPGTGIPRQLPFWYKEGGEDGNFMSGAGGVISNANDMAMWLQTLLLWGKNPATNETVIPPQVLQRAASGITVASDGISGLPIAQSILSPVVYGGGQEIGTYRGHVIIEHGGDVTGAHSQIARLPFENIGVAVLTNDDDTGPTISQIIKFRLLDQALGLTPFDWNALFSQAANASADVPSTPRPGNASDPSIPGGFPSLEGTYSDPGYESWSFCLFAPSHQPSEACQDLTTNTSTTLPGAINPNVPTLLAFANSIWFDYIRLEHFDGNVFNVTGLLSYSTNDTTEPFWTKVVSAPGLQAEFGLDDGALGVGFTGGLWGAGDGVPDPSGDTLKERSEIWMEKAAA